MYKLNRKSNRFSGQHVVITGASRGIGAEAAREFHKLGANVSILGIEPDLMTALCDELGENAHFIEVDVTKKQVLKKALKSCYEYFGDINALIANAGIYNVATLMDDDSGAFEKTIDVNLYGVYNTIKSAAPYMSKKNGYILTVSSMAALTNGPLMGAYAASKAAVEALTNSLRVELSGEGIAVGCAYFGAIDTDLVQGGKLHPALSKLEKSFPRFVRDPIPVEKAVAVITQGVQKRSARIWAPDWLALFIALRGVCQPVMEWRIQRSLYLKEALQVQRDRKRIDLISDVALGVSATHKK